MKIVVDTNVLISGVFFRWISLANFERGSGWQADNLCNNGNRG